MSGMTIKQIAETCGVDIKTVRRWVGKMSTLDGQNVQAETAVKKKMREAGRAGKPTYLTLEETLAIVRAGGRHTLASLLAENAKAQSGEDRIDRLPNGTQLHELRMTYGCGEAARRIDYIIGYSRQQAPASPEYAEKVFSNIKEDFRQRRLGFDGEK